MNDLSVSRTSFSWETSSKTKTCNLCLDALTNYLSALNFPDTKNIKYKNFWPGRSYYLKDILRFHAIYCQHLQLSTLPKSLYHGWILSRKKMSKSLGNILDPIDITIIMVLTN